MQALDWTSRLPLTVARRSSAGVKALSKLALRLPIELGEGPMDLKTSLIKVLPKGPSNIHVDITIHKKYIYI